MSLTAADLDTVRFMRARKTRAATIAGIFGLRCVDALLDAVLAISADPQPANGGGRG